MPVVITAEFLRSCVIELSVKAWQFERIEIALFLCGGDVLCAVACHIVRFSEKTIKSWRILSYLWVLCVGIAHRLVSSCVMRRIVLWLDVSEQADDFVCFWEFSQAGEPCE